MRDFARPLLGFAYQLTRDHSLAEDLVQDTFSEAWRSIASQREPEHARAWLFQIMRFRFAHFQKQRQRQSNTVSLNGAIDVESSRPDPNQQFDDRDAVESALMQLSDDLRQTFLMVFEQQMTCRATAEALGIPIGTVLSRLDRARKVLRKEKVFSQRADSRADLRADMYSGKSRAKP